MNDIIYSQSSVTFINSWCSPLQMEKIKKNKIAPGKKKLVSAELAKSKSLIIIEIVEYVPDAIVSKTIIKKTTGNVTVTSFAAGEELAEKSSPFDIFIQIIDGVAEIIIDSKVFKLKLGEGIIIPAHSTHSFNANEQFKMISTTIKSGYE